jgi:hypothetical protein
MHTWQTSVSSTEQLVNANELLAYIRKRLDELSGADRELRFVYTRNITKELGYDERGKPMARRKQLKKEK